jgi:hypothetical protein
MAPETESLGSASHRYHLGSVYVPRNAGAGRLELKREVFPSEFEQELE